MKLPDIYRFAAALALTFALGCAFGYVLSDHGSEPDAELAVNRQGNASRGDALAGDRASGTSSHTFGSDPADAAATDDFGRRIIAALRARDYFQRRYEIYALGQKLDAGTIRAAMEATQELKPSDRDSSQFVLLARWLELDASAAYDWVRELPSKERRSSLMREFFHSLGLKDPATALSYLSKHKADPSTGGDFTYSVFEAWSSADPLAASEAAFLLQDKSAQASALQITLARWAKKDPQLVLQRIASLPEDSARENYRRAALRAWAEEDPAAAVAHAETLAEGKERTDALCAVMKGTVLKDSALAAQMIERIPPGAARARMMDEIVREIGYKDPAAAAPFVLAMAPAEQRNAVHQVIHALSRQDPVAALEFAGKLTSLEARASATRMALQQWTQEDPKAAVEYCIRENAGSPQELGSAVSSWARKNAAEALAWSRNLPAGANRDAALGSALIGLGSTDPQEAIKLASSMLAPDQQANVFANVASSWAAKDAPAAVAWASQLKDRAAAMGVSSSIIHTWARKDPAAAASWVERHDGGMHAGTVAREWANVDPTATAKWLERIPTGNTRDQAVSSFARAVSDTDPAGAAEWAQTISQQVHRDNAIGEVYRKWKAADPKAADAWLRESPGVSDQARERFLKPSGSSGVYYPSGIPGL